MTATCVRRISVENVSSPKLLNETNASIMYQPIVKALQVGGSYSSWNTDNVNYVQKIQRTYCIMIQIIVILVSGRYLTVFRDSSEDLYEIVGLLAFAWHYLAEIVCSIGYFILNTKHIPIFLKTVDDHNYTYGFIINIRKMKRNVYRLTILCALITVIYPVSLVILYFNTLDRRNSLMSSNLTPFNHDSGESFVIAIVLFSIMMIIFFYIIFSNICFLIINLYVFKQEFRNIGVKVRDSSKRNDFEELAKIRLQHESLARVLNTANDIHGFVAGTVYGYGIPVICLALYGATTNRFNVADMVALVGTLIGVTIGMFIVTFLGAHLNKAAHGPLEDLFSIDTSSLSHGMIAKIQIFITRLTGTSIGLNVLDLFVIDHSTILMVFGTLITYAVVVIQFNLSPKTCSCGGTNSTSV